MVKTTNQILTLCLASIVYSDILAQTGRARTMGKHGKTHGSLRSFQVTIPYNFGWWFKEPWNFITFRILGMIILTDFNILQMGWNHQPEFEEFMPPSLQVYLQGVPLGQLVVVQLIIMVSMENGWTWPIHMDSHGYSLWIPLVNCYITMETHHV